MRPAASAFGPAGAAYCPDLCWPSRTAASALGPAGAAYCPDLCWPSRTAARTSCTVVSSPRACEAADFRR